MLVTKEEKNSALILRLEGRLDATTAIQLENVLNEAITGKQVQLLLDFSGIEYLSSAGMRILLSMTKRLKGMDGSFKLFAVHDDVMEIIRLAGFETILQIYPDESKALA
ncbi:MAG: Anti-sigma-B factor antagonist [Chlamydiia bacterium]|nr:Anti-sigma-B factor antagonist [Chlamydiia bacterium]MCH9618938.1 Anti-sigma-B factor antagonist [Chlamydiia bacterium]MCH9624752.1 Anti-sigma-B factor antagonist [Chlamydiia bacterium]